MNVLVIDDSRANLLVTGHFMRGIGYNVTEVPGGYEGLKCVEGQTKFNVILVDRDMPGMDGIEFIRRVRAMETMSKVPIIMITGQNSPEMIEAALSVGANEFVMKPLTGEALSSKLHLLGVS